MIQADLIILNNLTIPKQLNVYFIILNVVDSASCVCVYKIAMNIIKKHVENQNLDWNSNAIAITMKDSQLYKKAQFENWLKIFNLPDWVGGRTSITSSVGLLPLSLINRDVSEFIRGAAIMDELTRIPNIKDNPAALLSSAWFFSGDGIGKRDMVLLPYFPQNVVIFLTEVIYIA